MRKSPIRIDKVTLRIKVDNNPDLGDIRSSERLENFHAGLWFMVHLYIAAQVSYEVPGSNPPVRRSEIFRSGYLSIESDKDQSYFLEKSKGQLIELQRHLMHFRIDAVAEIFDWIRSNLSYGSKTPWEATQSIDGDLLYERQSG